MYQQQRNILNSVVVAFAVALSGVAQADVILGSLVADTNNFGSFVGNSSANVAGQTFTTPTAGDEFTLSEFTVLRGSGGFNKLDGAAGSDTAVYLNLYTEDDGDLNNSAASRTFVASSTNTVDVSTSSLDDELTWQFNVTLDPDTKYWAAFSGTAADGDFFAISLRQPESNDGTIGNKNDPTLEDFYDGGAQIFVTFGVGGDPDTLLEINDGFAGPKDLLFEAVLVPEPGSLSLAAVGAVLLLRRRFQRSNKG